MINRAEKYKSKIDGDVAKQRYDATKDLAVKKEKLATYDLVIIEKQIKTICQGVSTILLPYYIIFGKEIYRILKTHTDETAANEICILANKWYVRGLQAQYLNNITSLYSGGKIRCIMACDYPSEADVKDGVVYNFGASEGTYACVLGLPRTGQTTSYTDYDDGYYEAGLPAGAGVRFVYNTDNTITDNVTGLDWIQNPAITSGDGFDFANTYLWANAITAITAMNTANYGGHNDWRLPNLKELISIVDYGRIFPSINVSFFTSLSDYYWSNTTHASITEEAWIVNFNDGVTATDSKDPANYYVRPVRGGQLNP